MPKNLLPLPEITDDDIDWACDLMGLGELDACRREFLKARRSLDVSACPGSGKTTLVVAKLAILIRKWPYRTKGICVLSHTNVARAEIERRLGAMAIGNGPLGYPHFIGTIHSFVNRFLALPWLYSNGYPSPIVGDEATSAYRRRSLTPKEYQTLLRYLDRQHKCFDDLRICSRDLNFSVSGHRFPAGASTAMYRLAKRAVEAAAKAGYFCYDEMFVWGHALLDDVPDVAVWLRRRFPLVIVDEMQDTCTLQGKLLHRVFPSSSTDTVVQRVGDPNQAIFDSLEAKPDESDPFPTLDAQRHLVIPNSHRFGSQIATIASPFAVCWIGSSRLSGVGPRSVTGAPAECDNAVFIFPDDSTNGVLEAYGRHVLATFSDDTLAQSTVTAIGAVHRDTEDVRPGDAHFPKTLPHYWNGYVAELSRIEAHPRYLIQYIRIAQASVRCTREVSSGINCLASGLLRLADAIGDARHIRRSGRAHRVIVEALSAKPEVLAIYHRLVRMLVVKCTPVDKEMWEAVQCDLSAVACSLCSDGFRQSCPGDFLAWVADDQSRAVDTPLSPDDAGRNVYRVHDGDRHVDIRLGSVHSVKGQTHLATLLLDTYWYGRWFQKTLPLILGTQVDRRRIGPRDLQRLRLTYVALTRPSHMVCLAMPRSTLGNDNAEYERQVSLLMERRWRVAQIIDGTAIWCRSDR